MSRFSPSASSARSALLRNRTQHSRSRRARMQAEIPLALAAPIIHGKAASSRRCLFPVPPGLARGRQVSGGGYIALKKRAAGGLDRRFFALRYTTAPRHGLESDAWLGQTSLSTFGVLTWKHGRTTLARSASNILRPAGSASADMVRKRTRMKRPHKSHHHHQRRDSPCGPIRRIMPATLWVVDKAKRYSSLPTAPAWAW